MNKQENLKNHNIEQEKIYQNDLKIIGKNGYKSYVINGFLITIKRLMSGIFNAKIVIKTNKDINLSYYPDHSIFDGYLIESKRTELMINFDNPLNWNPKLGTSNKIDTIYLSYQDIVNYLNVEIIPQLIIDFGPVEPTI